MMQGIIAGKSLTELATTENNLELRPVTDHEVSQEEITQAAQHAYHTKKIGQEEEFCFRELMNVETIAIKPTNRSSSSPGLTFSIEKNEHDGHVTFVYEVNPETTHQKVTYKIRFVIYSYWWEPIYSTCFKLYGLDDNNEIRNNFDIKRVLGFNNPENINVKIWIDKV